MGKELTWSAGAVDGVFKTNFSWSPFLSWDPWAMDIGNFDMHLDKAVSNDFSTCGTSLLRTQWNSFSYLKIKVHIRGYIMHKSSRHHAYLVFLGPSFSFFLLRIYVKSFEFYLVNVKLNERFCHIFCARLRKPEVYYINCNFVQPVIFSFGVQAF